MLRDNRDLAQPRAHRRGERRLFCRGSGQPPRCVRQRATHEARHKLHRRGPHRFRLPGFLPAGLHSRKTTRSAASWSKFRTRPRPAPAIFRSSDRWWRSPAPCKVRSPPQDVLAAVVDAALSVTGAERGFLLLKNDEELDVSVARDRRGAALGPADLGVPRTLIQSRIAHSARPALHDVRSAGRRRHPARNVGRRISNCAAWCACH